MLSDRTLTGLVGFSLAEWCREWCRHRPHSLQYEHRSGRHSATAGIPRMARTALCSHGL